MANSPAPQAQANSGSCLNCGHVLHGRYCGNCGQEPKELRRPFFKLSAEAVHSVLELDGRAFRTLFCLLTKPGFLSREYFSGKRASYTPPLRLFLVISISYFLLISLYTSIQSFEEVLNGASSGEREQLITSNPENQDDEDDDDDGRDDIRQFIENINLPFFSEQINSNLRSAMQEQADSNMDTLIEDPGEFAAGYLEYITVFMLLMIPLLALIQKVVYIRSGNYYVEHLVLTLHNFSFIIFALFVNSVFDLVAQKQLFIVSALFDYAGTAVYIWLWVYLFLSLKNYFQQGKGITLLKFITATILYGLILGAGILVFSVILFFLF